MDGLNSFAEKNLSISALSTVVFVPEGTGSDEHINRAQYGMVFELSGASEYMFEDEKKTFLSLKQDEILFLPKASTYHVLHQHIAQSSCYCINFDTPVVLSEPFVYSPSNVKLILQHFQAAEKTWNRRSCGYYEQTMLELYGIISLLKQSIQSSKAQDIKQRMLNPAIKYIEENYMYETISISALADICGISDTYFRKLFKDYYSESPKCFIEKKRFEKAKELIATGEYNISAVAGMCGFFNDSYFSRKFKQMYGITPHRYMNIEKQSISI